MNRNTAFALAVFLPLCATGMGCGGSTAATVARDATMIATPGLANAPRLGGTPETDPRILDAIANGNDSCQRNAGGSVLRFQYPPCPTVESRPPATAGLDWQKRYISTEGQSTALRVSLPSSSSMWACLTPKRPIGFSPLAPRTPSALTCATLIDTRQH
jgi:hypothetical protein